jgi:hypothetical protein
LSQSDFDCSHIGLNVVVLTVVDPSGNTSSDTLVVTVLDTFDIKVSVPKVSHITNCGGNDGSLSFRLDLPDYSGSMNARLHSRGRGWIEYTNLQVVDDTLTLEGLIEDVYDSLQVVDANFTCNTDSLAFEILVRDNCKPLALSDTVTVEFGNLVYINMGSNNSDPLDSPQDSLRLYEIVRTPKYGRARIIGRDSIEFLSTSFSYRGLDTLVVSVKDNGIPTELSTFDTLFVRIVPPVLNVSDSLRLVAIRDNSLPKGAIAGWDSNKPAYDWPGVGRITRGDLRVLDLSSLGLTSVDTGALIGLGRLDTLKVERNQLRFNFLEPLVSADTFTVFTYNNQADVDQDTLIDRLVAESVVLVTSRTTASEQFQWYKDGELILGANSDTLVIEDLKLEDAGSYYTEITSGVAVDEMMTRKPIRLRVTDRLDATDSLKLVAIYNHFDGQNWTSIWDLTRPASTWVGLTIERRRAVGLDLGGFGLKGSFDAATADSLGGLSKLRRLSLFSNSISGSIPAQIGNLKELQYLDLENNKFSGSVPASFAGLDTLKTLWLSQNEISSISPQLGKMRSLEFLFLQSNQIAELSDSLTNLSRLLVLNAASNRLTRFNPAQKGFASLQRLNLSNNSLIEFSDSVARFAALKELLLSDNDLRNLPKDASTHQGIDLLNIRRNRLEFDDLEVFDFAGSVQVLYIPQKRIEPDYDTLLTTGVRLVLNSQIGGSANSYQWFKNDAELAGDTLRALTFNSVRVADAGLYEYGATNAKVPGLVIRGQRVRVLVNCGTFTASITTTNKLEFCEGDPILVNFEAQSNGVGVSYRWRRDNSVLGLANRPNFTAFLPGVYSVQATDRDGCVVLSNSITVSYVPLPEVDIDTVGVDSLRANAPTAGRYQWLLNGVEIDSATNQTIWIREPGRYSVRFTDTTSTGCSNTSSEIDYFPTQLDKSKLSQSIALYPNPNNGKFFVELGAVYVQISAEVYDGSGVLISYQHLSQTSQFALDISDRPAGVYTLILKTERGVAVKRFVMY